MWCSVSRTLALFPWLHCAKSGRVAQGCMCWSAIYRGVSGSFGKTSYGTCGAPWMVICCLPDLCIEPCHVLPGICIFVRAWPRCIFHRRLSMGKGLMELAPLRMLGVGATKRMKPWSTIWQSMQLVSGIIRNGTIVRRRQGSGDANLQEHWRSLRARSGYSCASKRRCSCKT